MNIIYISELDFSKLNASTKRIINISKAITDGTKNNVTIIGYGNTNNLNVEGFKIIQTEKGFSIIGKVKNSLLRGFQFLRVLRNISNTDAIIYYGSSSLILLPLRKYCRANKIKLIVDIVEWYDYSSLPFGSYGPIALSTHYAMTNLIKKSNGIIAISSFLESYYKKANKMVLRVPVLMQQDDCRLVKSNSVQFESTKIHLIYAGTPGKKDLILDLIKAVEVYDYKGEKLNFHILGPQRIELEKLNGGHLGQSIICHGRVRQDLVPSYLQASDFSVLLRPDKRYAHAGFSTKFVESLVNGIPVIANITGDIGEFLIDNYNGFVVKDLTQKELCLALSKACSLSRNEIDRLKANARQCGIKNFGVELYSDDINNFLKQVQDDNNN